MNLPEAIQHNCDVSDAKDNGIYSLCTLVLKLRNLYKWQHNLNPWEEPEPAEVLDWIADKESFWEEIKDDPFQPLPINDRKIEPFDVSQVNDHLHGSDLYYGAGYGRSMKAVFFLAEKLEEMVVEECPVLVLGKERVRDLSSPFAMFQDGTIIIRKEQLRFFFWDHIQELQSSYKPALRYVLTRYGLYDEKGALAKDRLIASLDHIVDQEMLSIIFHEVGEAQEIPLNSETMKEIIQMFPGSLIEHFVRATKDVLADTHPKGMLGHIIGNKKESSLGFYVSFLDGLRKLLMPEIDNVFSDFIGDDDWYKVDRAREIARERNLKRANMLQQIFQSVGRENPEQIKKKVQEQLITPLGLA